eukprot:TRINITY_DN8650_c0_g3_i1.p1 TRINITY_DN8650_c0_g3~~TRINITY_DN8650_c0_g3_i1.p1  ORF type:complete len:509 (-),score=71.88 TRINITY_DN8650_c0_g3_i1:171-1697(-)
MIGDLALFAISTLYIFVCPYTKVEESFNAQATHDIIFNALDLSKYDHFEFPGVVPRTFIGSLVLACLSMPFHFVFSLFGLPKIWMLYVVRTCLAGLNVAALGFFRRCLARKFSVPALANHFSLLLCLQFHLPFYISRPLPNTFALAVCTLAFSFWLLGRYSLTVGLLAFAAIVFRCDVVLVAGPLLLMALVLRRTTIRCLLVSGVVASLLSLVVTVLVDSFFWQRWIWPEGEVFWFNTYYNQSSKWGTSPFHWYFTSALPRALLPLNLALLPAGLFLYQALPASTMAMAWYRPWRWMRLNPDACELLAPALIFVCLYSFLPHKELRFIFPALPLFTAISALGLTRISHLNLPQKLEIWRGWRVARLGVTTLSVVNLCLVGVFVYVAAWNYPGGHALRAFHAHYRDVPLDRTRGLPIVHIDNLAATTGVSRFLEENERFRYSKVEHLEEVDYLKPEFNFDFLINEKCNVSGFSAVSSVRSFHSISIGEKRIRLEPALCILQRDLASMNQ